MKYLHILFIFPARLFYYLNLIFCLFSILTFNQISTKEIKSFDENLTTKINNTTKNSDSFYIEHQHNYSSHRHHKNRLKKSENKASGNDNLIVQTQSGRIRGTSFYVDEHLDNQNKPSRIDAWLGIPFAEKPIGNLRFKRPVPIKGWDDILNATELPNSCYQLRDLVFENFPGAEMWNPNTNVSEDCLYLNIWAPYPRPRNAAVMVWIFGGGFYSGSITLKVYDPKIFVAETQVILVAMQYRLSIFGFLFLDHINAPGNQGLIDQQLALKWIHNNIQYFGGDNKRITIFGESAGAASVSMHLLSRQSSNLFTNAILQSGSALADWATLKNSEALSRCKGVLDAFGCSVSNTSIDKAIECAQKVDPVDALQKSDEYFYDKATHGIAQFIFVPVVDNYFLDEEPIILLNRGKFKKCSILSGANKDEGNWFFLYSFKNFRDKFNVSEPPAYTYSDFEQHIAELFHFYPQFPYTASPLILKSIAYRYTNWGNVNDSEQNRQNLDDAAGDFHFVCPVVDLANQYSFYGQKVYFYYYTHRSSKHFWPDWLGVMHADEVGYVFGEPLNNTLNYNDKEKVLTRRILKYWSNFAKYGDPNGFLDINDNITYATQEKANKLFSESEIKTKTLSQPIEYWPIYKLGINTDKERIFMRLDAYETELGNNFRADYCAFWGKYMSEISLYENKFLYNSNSANPLNSANKLEILNLLIFLTIIKFSFSLNLKL